MKTIGERIRQARVARNMSGEELALAVGYKHQSAIANLENRVTGTGGTKIAKIAATLRVPIRWLLEGPDSDEVPFSEPLIAFQDIQCDPHATTLEQGTTSYHEDGSLTEAMQLFKKLTSEQRVKVISYMQFISAEDHRRSEASDGDHHPVPHPKAA